MKSENRLSWIEIVVVLAIMAIVARLIWAKEIFELENGALLALGLPVSAKYFLTVPLAALFYYGIYKKESLKAKKDGVPVVGRTTWAIAIVLLSVIGLLLAHMANNNA